MASSSNKTTIAMILVAVAIAAWIIVLMPKRSGGGQYYYDLGSSQLFVALPQATTPIPSPSGGEGVIAVVMACGDCDNDAERFIAYLEKTSDNYAKVLASGEAPTPQQLQNRSVVRAVDGDTWLPAVSPDAQKVIAAAKARCNAPPLYCQP